MISPFIVFEGIDGAGKSTLIQSVFKELQKMGVICMITREPGGTPLGEQVRKWVLDPKTNLSAQTELFLISAARRDHVEKVIQPALAAGKWILCDRFWASTNAFQGNGRGLPNNQIQQMNIFSTANIQPDLWILLDLPIQDKEKRNREREAISDTFESQDRNFHQRVKEAYLQLAKKNKTHWYILNAMLSVKKLTQLVIQEVQRRQWLN